MIADIGALYRKYALDVCRYSHYLCGNRSDAEDITSETFVRAWTAPEIRAVTVKGYLFTIARNLYLQGLRKSSRMVELDEEIADSQAGPYTRAEQSSDIHAVWLRLQQLPEVDRAALLMRGLDEMPYEEIALSLGISLASAKVKVHRARLALADIRNV